MIGNIPKVQPLATAVARVNDFLDRLSRLNDHIVTGQWAMPEMIDRAYIGICLNDLMG